MTRTLESQIPELTTIVRGLRQDLPAEQAAVRSPWSNGPVERQVNRLELVKRSMYGRADLHLLRKRVPLSA